MAQFRYAGPHGRVHYPTLGVTVSPGDIHEFEEAPDSHWVALEEESDNPKGDE